MLIELVGSSSFPSRPSTEEEELQDSKELNFNVFLLALQTKIVPAKRHVSYLSKQKKKIFYMGYMINRHGFLQNNLSWHFMLFSLCGTAAFPSAIRIFLANYAEGFFPCFFRSLLPGSASGAACHPQWAPRGLLFSSGDCAQIRLLSRLCHGRFCPCQMLPLQRHGSVVWPRYYM